MNEKIIKERKIVLVVILIVLLGIVGFIVHAKSNGNVKQEIYDLSIEHCKNELLPAYEDGFMTSLISDLDAFARECIGGDAKVYSWINANGKTNGVLVFCTVSNKTYSLKYPNVRNYK